MHAQSKPLKLYGIALAAVAVNNDPQHLEITCTPIGVASDQREVITTLDKLAFKKNIHLTDMDEVLETYQQLVGTLDAVVKLQKKSLAAHHLAYRPVALDIGEDRERSVATALLTTYLFGRVWPLGIKTEEEAELYRLNSAEKAECTADSRRELVVYQNLEEIPDQVKDQLKKSVPYQNLMDDEFKRGKLLKRQTSFFEEHPDKARDFSEASKRLPGLLKQSTLKWGSFHVLSGDIDTHPTEDDRELIELKSRIDEGDIKAHYEVIKLAKNYGYRLGDAVNERPDGFKAGAPKGYFKDKVMQALLPSYGSYLAWSPDYRAAFNQAYQTAYKGPYTRTLQLAHEPPEQPFVSIVADMIRDQLQIVDGKRAPENIDDAADSRDHMGHAAKMNGLRLDTGRKPLAQKSPNEVNWIDNLDIPPTGRRK